MTIKSELRQIGKLHRWAFEELVFDQLMQEINRVGSSGTKRVREYLTAAYGSPERLLAAAFRRLKRAGEPDAQLKCAFGVRAVFREFQWLPEEMLYAVAKREAAELFLTIGSMYCYLKKCYGSGAEVLKVLSWIVRVQKRRAKTLCM